MPLTKGKSQAAVKKNVETMVHEWEKDGAIGTSHPKTKKKAIQQAVAISLKRAGKSKYQQGTTKK